MILRKITVSVILLLAIHNQAYSQDWQSYMQLSAGMGIEKGCLLRGEYGKTWKWIDVSVSMDYETTVPFKYYHEDVEIWKKAPNSYSITKYYDESFGISTSASFGINSKVDLIGLFYQNSRHAFKVGAGLSYTQVHSSYVKYFPAPTDLDDSARESTISLMLNNNIKSSLITTYEFEVTPKVALGAFFYASDNIISSSFGVSVRRNF